MREIDSKDELQMFLHLVNFSGNLTINQTTNTCPNGKICPGIEFEGVKSIVSTVSVLLRYTTFKNSNEGSPWLSG